MIQIVLTSAELDDLAREFVNELHKIPLYDVAQKERLASEYLRKVQTLLVANTHALPKELSVRSVLFSEKLKGDW